MTNALPPREKLGSFIEARGSALFWKEDAPPSALHDPQLGGKPVSTRCLPRRGGTWFKFLGRWLPFGAVYEELREKGDG